jgi:hypothetical protein
MTESLTGWIESKGSRPAAHLTAIGALGTVLQPRRDELPDDLRLSPRLGNGQSPVPHRLQPQAHPSGDAHAWPGGCIRCEDRRAAAFYLGAMAHYIGDVSQYGHTVPFPF